MRLSNYINYLTEYKNTYFDESKLQTIIRKNCKKSWNAYRSGNAVIYRGISGMQDQFFIVTPTKGTERRSRYADGNYYTLLIDNLPSWSNYPKRSRSVVCSTNIDNAEGRSDGSGAYIVLPFDGSKIAVCSEEDIWISFPNLDMNSWHKGDINQLNTFFHESGISENGFPDSLKKITNKDFFRDFNDSYQDSQVIRKLFYKFADLPNTVTLYDFLNKEMNPAVNDFSIVTAGSKIKKDVEVWTEGRCLLIKNDIDLKLEKLK